MSSDRFEALRAELSGTLHLPDSSGFEAARGLWNGMIRSRPAAIAECRGSGDVVRAVSFARSAGLPVSVRGGGHGVAGAAMRDGALALRLAPMKGLRIDPTERVAVAEPGLTGREFDAQTQAFGLATTLGIVSSTGIAGLTLGGGFGWTARAFGLACDNVLGFDVVTADGEFVQADAERNPDLFWALRGGGGYFGVVTAFRYRLHALGPVVLGGLVVHPLKAAADLARFYFDFTASLPDAASAYLFFPTGPDGQRVCAIGFMATAPPGMAEGIVKPLREFGTPLDDGIRAVPYVQLQQAFDPTAPFGLYQYWKSGFLRGERFDDEAIEALVEGVHRLSSPRSMVAVDQFGGAISAVPADSTAYVHRAAKYQWAVYSTWEGPGDDARHVACARDFAAQMAPYLSRSVYQNYEQEVDDAATALYGANQTRLAAVKRRYDPDGVFPGTGAVRA